MNWFILFVKYYDKEMVRLFINWISTDTDLFNRKLNYLILYDI